MLALFEEMFINKMVIRESISLVMEEYGSQLQYSSELLNIHR